MLQPHRDLKEIVIENYMCTKFPDEVEDAEHEQLQVANLCNVASLTIRKHGLNIESLRISKDFLAFHAETRIEKFPNIVSFAKNNFPPALKKLMNKDCMNLQSLVNGVSVSISYSCLIEHLEIRGCAPLISLSLPVRLQHLDISKRQSKILLEGKLVRNWPRIIV
ncbi:hypothetical protein PTKIN_Ptkin14bG0211700 [Pterospermum kingtungense]